MNETEKTARVLAVCVSEKKGEQKHPVDEIELRPDWGIVGDAHAGHWHRQEKLGDFRLRPGDFAENILVEGITLYKLPVGARLALGEKAVGEVTQIGKECHNDCAIRRKAGDCVMPREGIFVKILAGGTLKAGDTVRVIG